ncbi:LysE family translocator [Nesterenkonia cremea]|uniref:Membrane protein n=1 Tax=Nesterenkonia cremea TaxID=1882340 RepID=A0A917AU59_9MICC|nr:LysE family translocator [Nesterenkonia cremea]GGE75715.1 membrane protein [Nesterenkonia cremea]
MLDFTVLPQFIAVIMLFLLPPGQDMAYMVAVGFQGGRLAAVRAILGIGTGMSVYATGVSLGLGAVVESNPMILDAVRILGAAYLAWLAHQSIKHARSAVHGQTVEASGNWYLKGTVISITNPKIILFYLAVLPQFLGSASNSMAQMFMLGAVNVMSEVLLYGTLGLLAGSLHSKFTNSSKAPIVLNIIAGSVYLLLAIIIVVNLILSR